MFSKYTLFFLILQFLATLWISISIEGQVICGRTIDADNYTKYYRTFKTVQVPNTNFTGFIHQIKFEPHVKV